MSRKKDEKNVAIDRPQFPEAEDVSGFADYLRDKGVVDYVYGCPCYSCNSNRKYFAEHWSVLHN